MTPEERVRRYTPHAILQEDWEPVASFTRDVALELHPAAPRRATEAMRTLSQYVVWAHRQGMPLEKEAVFSPDLVERYVAVGCTHLAASSRATRRADLRRFSMALTRTAPWAALPTLLRAEYRVVPYTADDVTRLMEVAELQRTKLLRRRLTALLALGLGTGVYPREARLAVTDDLFRRHGHLTLSVRGEFARLVPVAPPFDDALGRIRRNHPHETVLGFKAESWDKAPLGHLLEHIERPADCPDIKANRLRVTWILRQLTNRVHLAGLAQMAGLASWKSFSHLMAYLPPISESELFEELCQP